MKVYLKKQLWLFLTIIVLSLSVSGQGQPPGWDYTPTPTTHIISISLESNPNINGFAINPGDWIGVFYINDEGNLSCGGAAEWLGDQNTGIIAFGDDSFTSEKDGFDSGETINFKVYSWSVEKEYDAVVTCDTTLPSSCDTFTANGLSGVASLDATGFYIVVSAQPDSVCHGDPVQLNAIASGGTGNYTYSWTSSPPGFTSDISDPQVVPDENTVYFVEVTDSPEVLESSVQVMVFPAPEANAGNDFTICENNVASLSGQAANYQSFLWSSDGDGEFSDPGTLNPDYSPGNNDIISGSVTLTLTAQPVEPCVAAVSDDMLLFITQQPQVNAGEDQSICEGSNVQLSASVQNYSSLLWTTSGDGTFSDPSLSDPVYVPGPGDIASGSVTLEIAANPVSPCSASVSDLVTISIVLLPEVNAGDNIVICEGETVALSGDAANFESVLWVTNGDGDFTDPTSLITTYIPGDDDVLTGGAVLSLIAQPLSPCVDVITDNLDLAITLLPTANAGPDASVCETDDHQLNGSASAYEEVIWSTSGDGFFGDPNSLNTFYTPGADDIVNGEVVLTLTALPQFPCTLNGEDDLTLEIINLPEVDAGEDGSVCEDENFQLNGQASNYLLIQWVTSGDGSYNNATILNPVYSPGEQDIENGFVSLKLTAISISPCIEMAQDSLELSIVKLPEANAGDDATVQSGDDYQLQGMAENYSTLLWSTSGDGVFSDNGIPDPFYTPGQQDILNTEVVLTLTANPLNPCTLSVSDDMILEIDTLTGIWNHDRKQMEISTFPNPCPGILTVEVPLPDKVSGFNVAVLSLNGRLIKESILPVEMNGEKLFTFQIDLSGFENGIYFILVTSDNLIWSSKIILRKTYEMNGSY